MPDTAAINYDYILFDVTLVQEVFRHRPRLRPDAYLSESWDGEVDAIRQACLNGYRWARTEGVLAVFEKQVPSPALNISLPRHIAAQAADPTVHEGVKNGSTRLDG